MNEHGRLRVTESHEYSWAGDGSGWSLPPDLAELAADGDSDLIVELIQMFLSDTGPRLQVLSRAWANRDLETVQKQAHSMKGSCSQLGALNLALLCKQIESATGQNSTDALQSLIEMAAEQFQSVSAAMQEHVNAAGV